MTLKYKSIISLNDIDIKVKIGVGDEERSVAQDIKIFFKIGFEDTPKPCLSDDVADTVCYYKITKIIKNYCNSHEFNLLEYLCFQLYQEIKNNIDSDLSAGVWVKVVKCRPPIEDFNGTATFELGDF